LHSVLHSKLYRKALCSVLNARCSRQYLLYSALWTRAALSWSGIGTEAAHSCI